MYYCVIGKSDAHRDVQRQAETAARIEFSEHVCIPIDEEPLSLCYLPNRILYAYIEVYLYNVFLLFI